ncbi:hypothetical protein TEA_000026 [Camellia sinensis var. sinensis]|uniref:Uncharacterized protein n=1 Tax=Camellia sinensis var. sinensis TaxID=542762 RepID=A0A4V6RYH9_CAMSN|nr:hypothetical protein TEA_000026 [Camellia sinensis var. sinensis]
MAATTVTRERRKKWEPISLSISHRPTELPRQERVGFSVPDSCAQKKLIVTASLCFAGDSAPGGLSFSESYELAEEACSPLPGFVELPTCPVCLVQVIHRALPFISYYGNLLQAYGINHLVLPPRDYLFAPSLSDICQAVDFIHGRLEWMGQAGPGSSDLCLLMWPVSHLSCVRMPLGDTVQVDSSCPGLCQLSYATGPSFSPTKGIVIRKRNSNRIADREGGRAGGVGQEAYRPRGWPSETGRQRGVPTTRVAE